MNIPIFWSGLTGSDDFKT